MKKLVLVLALVAIALPALAGNVNIPVIATDPDTQDPHLKGFVRWLNAQTCQSVGLAKGCTDAQAKEKNPAAVIYPDTIAGFELYATDLMKNAITSIALQQQERKAARDVAAGYKAANATIKAQVDALLGIE